MNQQLDLVAPKSRYASKIHPWFQSHCVTGVRASAGRRRRPRLLARNQQQQFSSHMCSAAHPSYNLH